MFFGDALAVGNADVAVNECPQFGERLKVRDHRGCSPISSDLSKGCKFVLFWLKN
jgi:hypothetical protein